MPGPSRARLEKVVCRVVGCVDKEGNQRSMNRSSYKEHLVLKHPSENCNDPGGFCSKIQPKLNFSKSKKSSSNIQQKSRQEQGEKDQGQEQQGQGQGKEKQGQGTEQQGLEKEQPGREKEQQGRGEVLQEWEEPG